MIAMTADNHFEHEKRVVTIRKRETVVSALVQTNGWNVPTAVTFILFKEPDPVVVEKEPEFHYGK